MKEKDDRAFLRSILNMIARIERHKISDAFVETIFDAIVFDLITIGEAVNKLSASLKEAHPDIPWVKIVDQRNVLIHNHMDINERIVWDVVENRLSVLKAQIETILVELDNHG